VKKDKLAAAALALAAAKTGGSVTVDEELSAGSANPVQNKAINAALAGKADVDGYCEDLISGGAEQIIASVGVTDKVPYNFRASGGGADIGNREDDKLVGGTIVWNQLVDTDTEEVATVSGHIYLTVIGGVSSVSAGDGTAISVTGGTDMAFDLTKMFGAAIASYVNTLETGAAGAGTAWFRKLFPKSGYAYNAGTLTSVRTGKHVTTGFNAYDHSKGTAKLVGGIQYQITGAFTSLAYADADGVSGTVTPDAGGYFTPSKNGTLTVTGGNGTTTCVHIVRSGSRDGEWEKFKKHEYLLDGSVELRGVPKLDANNSLYYDGDVYTSDGTVTRKFEYRAYAEGDESIENALTDGVNTVYPLNAPVSEDAEPFTNPQITDVFGTEEYVDTRDVAVPVGHETFYQADLRGKLQRLPDPAESDGTYAIQQTGDQMSLVPAGQDLYLHHIEVAFQAGYNGNAVADIYTTRSSKFTFSTLKSYLISSKNYVAACGYSSRNGNVTIVKELKPIGNNIVVTGPRSDFSMEDSAVVNSVVDDNVAKIL